MCSRMRVATLILLYIFTLSPNAQAASLAPTKGSWCAALLNRKSYPYRIDPDVIAALEQADQKLDPQGSIQEALAQQPSYLQKHYADSYDAYFADVLSPGFADKRSDMSGRIRALLYEVYHLDANELILGQVVVGKANIFDFINSVEVLAYGIDSEYANHFD